MNDDQELTAALAAADRQLALAEDGFKRTVEQARVLLTTHGVTETWAVLSTRLARELSCTGTWQLFAVQMLAAAAVRAASPSEEM